MATSYVSETQYVDGSQTSTTTRTVSTGSSTSYSKTGYKCSLSVTASSGWKTTITGNGTSTAKITYNTVPSSGLEYCILSVFFTSSTTIYTVTLKDNYTGGSTSTVSGAKGKTFTLPTPTRSGYNCTGWYTASSGGTKVGDCGDTYTISKTTTIYAHWVSAPSSGYAYISYYLDGSYYTNETIEVENGDTYTVSLSGAVFQSLSKTGGGTGWSTSISGSKITFTTVSSSNQIYFQANYRSLYQYTVSYNKGSYGSGTNQTATKYEGTALTLKGAIFTRDGYTQTGWSTTDGGSKSYNLSGSYTTDAEITLYPYWTQNTYTITYDPGAYASGSQSTATKYGGVTLTLKGAQYTRSGYIQAGWSTSYYGSTKSYELSGSYTANAAATLYPYWVRIYTVTYNKGTYGSGTNRTATKTAGVALTLLGDIFTRTAYAQTGWSTSNLGSKSYELNGSYTTDADTTLYPYWTRTECVVIFDPNGGEAVTAYKAIAIGSPYGELPTATWAGHTFQGWWTAKSGGTQVFSDTIVTSNVDHTLYAHWTQTGGEEYTLYFDANGGSVSPTSKTITSGSAYGSLPTPTRSGFSFQGWWTQPSGGTSVTSSTVASSSDAVIYAHWQGTAYTITFDAHGGTSSESTRTVYSGNTIGTLPTPTKSGYTFLGWFTAETGGTQIFESQVVTYSMTLHAHWTESTIPITIVRYKIKFELNGGTLDSTYECKYTMGYARTLPTSSQVTKSGYTFGGWYDNEALSGSAITQIVAGSTGTKKFYAKWT